MTENELRRQIELMTYWVRGQSVLLDTDLADLYQVECDQIRRQVAKHKHRFPAHLCFRLELAEWQNINLGAISPVQLPLAFTSFGFLMLAAVLNTPRATSIYLHFIREYT